MTLDLVAEHATLSHEQAELQKLCVDEWAIMSVQVTRQRQARLWEIRDRLIVIEQSASWKRRDA